MALLTIACAVGLSGCASKPSAEAQARADALVTARKVASLGERRLPWTRDQLGRRAAVMNGLAVVRAEGEVATVEPGVTLTVLVNAEGVEPGDGFLDPGGTMRTFSFCFDIRFSPSAARTPAEVPCASSEPVTFPPAPAPPTLPTQEQLKTLLTTAGADERAIRDALAALKLDPQVHVEISAPAPGIAGVAARAQNPEDFTLSCVMARDREGTVETWSPSRVQLQPGELTCSAGEAAAGQGMNPPH